MWIFTKYGFFSVVCARQGDGAHGQSVDPDRVMVRARRRGHLEGLMQKFTGLGSSGDIREDPGADYRYRVFVPKAACGSVVAAIALDIDYDNFKGAVEEQSGLVDGDAYSAALHEVWEIMYDQQAEA